jgi:hypothetical protein
MIPSENMRYYFSRRMQIMEAFKDNFDPFRKKPVDLLVLPWGLYHKTYYSHNLRIL